MLSQGSGPRGDPDFSESRRGRKRQRSPSEETNGSTSEKRSPQNGGFHHQPSLPSRESSGFRGRCRHRSTSPFFSTSRNTSNGLQTRSCSPRPNKRTPGRTEILPLARGASTLLKWTGERRRRSQSPSRSPQGWKEGAAESKRRRHRTRSRRRSWAWELMGEPDATGMSGSRGTGRGSPRKLSSTLSCLRSEIKCDDDGVQATGK